MPRFSLALIGPIVVLALAGMTAPTLAKSRVGAAASPSIVQSCDWDRPGRNPFMGDVVAAIDGYQDIPAEARERLKMRMVKRTYDDVVTIRRDSIRGKAQYGTTIRDMHFGTHQVCRSVTRSAWTAQMQERGLVYCDGSDCILVPTVCRNVSRIARAQVADERAEGDGPPLEVVPSAPDGLVPVALEIDLPSGLPALNSQPPIASSFTVESGSFSAGGAIAGSVGLLPSTSVPPAFDSSPRSPGVNAARTLSSSELSAAVSAVPEPETWSLLLGGLGTLGALTRRHRKNS